MHFSCGGCVRWILAPWWQGVAGIAQMLAAIFAVVTIIQARKTIREAEAERKLSVAPDWDIAGVYVSGPAEGTASVYIYIRNTGFGPARDFRCRFEPSSNNHPEEISFGIAGVRDGKWCFADDSMGFIPVDGSLRVDLSWQIDRPLDGTLAFTYKTRVAEQEVKKFRLRTWISDGEPGCSIARED